MLANGDPGRNMGSVWSGGGGGGGSASSGGHGGSANPGGGGGKMMKAPGGGGAYISRPGFESNPQGYFQDLRKGGK